MEPTTFLVIGSVLVGLSLLILAVTLVIGDGSATGAARGLAIIERRISATEVSKNELPAAERLLNPIFEHTKSLGVRLSPSGTTERLAKYLNMAGNPPGWTAERIMGAKGAGMVAGLFVAFIIGGFSPSGLLMMAAGATVGFFLPDLLVYNRGQKRQEELQSGLADAIDMLTVCVEAGQGFDAGLAQVARAIKGPVAGEFARVIAEIQIGKARGEAFASLGERTTVPEIKNFVSSLVQADRLGLPVGNVLREQSREMRLARRQRAEQQAQKVPIKILFPMLLFIFPVVFIIILGPAVIRMIDVFSNM